MTMWTGAPGNFSPNEILCTGSNLRRKKKKAKTYCYITRIPLSHQQLIQFIITSYGQNIYQYWATQGCMLPFDFVRFQKQGCFGRTYAFTILCIWYNYAKKQHHSLAVSLYEAMSARLDFSY